MGSRYGKTIGASKLDGALIILFSGTKFLGELFRGEVLVIIGAGRIIELLQKCVEKRPVSQGQSDRKVQFLTLRQTADGLKRPDRARHVAAKDLTF